MTDLHVTLHVTNPSARRPTAPPWVAYVASAVRHHHFGPLPPPAMLFARRPADLPADTLAWASRHIDNGQWAVFCTPELLQLPLDFVVCVIAHELVHCACDVWPPTHAAPFLEIANRVGSAIGVPAFDDGARWPMPAAFYPDLAVPAEEGCLIWPASRLLGAPRDAPWPEVRASILGAWGGV